MNDKEIKALISLLDDEDTEILSHVEDKIISLGNSIIPFLETEWENNFNPVIQKKLEELIHTLQFESFVSKLTEWKENGGKDLLEGMWIVATYQYPDLEIDKIKKDLEQIYYDVWLEFKNDIQPYDQVRILNGVIFSKLKFSANTKNFHSPGNSMINVVLETKKGNPISLCVTYMLVAQKLKLPIYGVNLPNLFILTYKSDEVQFYINAFNRGLIFSKADIDNYLSHLNLNRLDMFYQPCSNIDIIRRVMRNLIISFQKIGEPQRAEEINSLLTRVFGGDTDDIIGA